MYIHTSNLIHLAPLLYTIQRMVNMYVHAAFISNAQGASYVT